MSRSLEIFIDGACQGNPGPAAIGVIIFENKKQIKELSQAIGPATNNIAEYTAFVHALQEALILKADKVKVYTDSELLYQQVKGNYKIKNPKLKILFSQAQPMVEGIKDFTIQHVPREKNREADRLAAKAIQKKTN